MPQPNSKVTLTDKIARQARPPAKGNKLTYDTAERGLALRVTANGSRAWVLGYSVKGAERRITLGQFPEMDASAARAKAGELRRQIKDGIDPKASAKPEATGGEAPTVAALAAQFVAKHCGPPLRPGTVANYRLLARLYILPAIGDRLVAQLDKDTVKTWYEALAAKHPVAGNRAHTLLSAMLKLAVELGMRADNPARGIKRGKEHPVNHYLRDAEIARLMAVLDRCGPNGASVLPGRTSVAAIKLMLLTGARRGETLTARWRDFNLESGIWTKPHDMTKTDVEHVVPLSVVAVALLKGMREDALAEDRQRMARGLEPIPWVFPGSNGKPLREVKRTFKRALQLAGIEGRVRVHDLRHTHASLLARGGQRLEVIQKLLGHKRLETTQRYAKLDVAALREAAELAGSKIAALDNVVKLKSA